MTYEWQNKAFFKALPIKENLRKELHFRGRWAQVAAIFPLATVLFQWLLRRLRESRQGGGMVR
jgi:hypothetical protein